MSFCIAASSANWQKEKTEELSKKDDVKWRHFLNFRIYYREKVMCSSTTKYHFSLWMQMVGFNPSFPQQQPSVCCKMNDLHFNFNWKIPSYSLSPFTYVLEYVTTVEKLILISVIFKCRKIVSSSVSNDDANCQ